MKSNYIVRPYQAPHDLPVLLEMIRSRPAGRELDHPSLADLREMLNVEQICAAARLWETHDGHLAGFAVLNRGETYASLSLEYSAQAGAAEIAGKMIAWAEGFFRESYRGSAPALSCSAAESDPARIALLERHGFIRDEETALKLERDLSEPISPPTLPEGFSIRCLSVDEQAAWVALHRAAFETENMTLEERQAMAGSPEYDPQLDLVATAPDGSLAAYVFGSISREENQQTGLKIGYADPVGTHPAYQRRGLSRALLLECLHRLRERGMQTARMGTGSWNTAMQHAAQSVGFRVVQRTLLFEKKFQDE